MPKRKDRGEKDEWGTVWCVQHGPFYCFLYIAINIVPKPNLFAVSRLSIALSINRLILSLATRNLERWLHCNL